VPEEGGQSDTRRFVSAGLDLVGLETGDDELAVIEAVDAIYRPLVDAMIRAELDGVEPEPGEDMSRGPGALERR
jgi:hypothetical protein